MPSLPSTRTRSARTCHTCNHARAHGTAASTCTHARPYLRARVGVIEVMHVYNIQHDTYNMTRAVISVVDVMRAYKFLLLLEPVVCADYYGPQLWTA